VLVRDLAGPAHAVAIRDGHLRLWPPTAAAAAAAATALIWAIAG
jgi:hypothetical protein